MGVSLEGALHDTSKLKKGKKKITSNITEMSHKYLSFIVSEEISSLSVERVVRIWLVEEINETVDHSVDVQHWLPLLAENVQTHVSFQVDIGVIYLRAAGYFRGLVRVQRGDGNGEHVLGAAPEAGVRRDGDIEISQVIGIREINLCDRPAVQISNIYGSESREAIFVICWDNTGTNTSKEEWDFLSNLPF